MASIRRIIESNEPNAENVLNGQLPPVYAEDEIEDGEEPGFVPEMAANDRGAPLRNEPMNYPSGPSGQPDRTLSLADVAARVRAASARQQETGTVRLATASTAPTPAPSAQASSSPAPAARQEQPAPLRPQMPEFREPVAQAMQAAPVPQPAAPQPEPAPRVMMPVFDPPLSAPVRAEAPVRPEPKIEPKLAAEPAPRSLPAKIEETANLLSAEAGAQVAKSFSELASVFNGMERRSLEDMAGDMLRPMLQEWLDDNLPTLVERLVREEIERVSRGTRR
ncbi:cell pole-organizing protein PopZ [Neorhizobium sp. 2083]|nr:cell pole-organizing protein PopZ [Neorhizobium sp. 2083]